MTPVTAIADLKPSYIREILNLANHDDIISLAGGLPCPETFPTQILEEVMPAIAADKQLLQYAPTAGYAPLISHLHARFQVPETHGVMVTTGSQQGIDLCARVFLGHGDKVVTESPSYLGALQVFAIAQATVLSVTQESDGPNLQQLEDHFKAGDVKCFYTVPDFHNPTGCCWSLEKRQAVAALCIRYQVLLIEDAPYRDIRFSGTSLPLVSSFCPEVAICLRSFSKILAPGLRVAALIMPKRWLPLFDKVKQATDLHSASLTQGVALAVLEHSAFEQHLADTVARYSTHYEALANELDVLCRELGSGYQFDPVEGGMFIWLKLPDCDTYQVAKAAIENGVTVVPSAEFYPSSSKPQAALRLNFSHNEPAVIREGISRLKQTLVSTLGCAAR